jgi:GTP-binding protein
VQSKFVLSAASAADFPRTGLPEVAMVGRSNVGKSSLINALVKQKIARTSAAAGKTRLANYYLIDDSYYLVDLPGYGYARGGRESVEEFEALTQQYFDPSSQPGRVMGGVLHLIDARHPDLPQDDAAYGWILRTGLPVAIVATKIDKLTRAEQGRALRTLENRHGALVLPESALDGTGLPEIRKLVHQWRDSAV